MDTRIYVVQATGAQYPTFMERGVVLPKGVCLDSVVQDRALTTRPKAQHVALW
jgi:hypothetical protein